MVCTHCLRIMLNKNSVATVMLSMCRKETKYERQSCDTFPQTKKRGRLRVALRFLICLFFFLHKVSQGFWRFATLATLRHLRHVL